MNSLQFLNLFFTLKLLNLKKRVSTRFPNSLNFLKILHHQKKSVKI